ncbi:phage holin family protein [Caldibacillus thermoamylovorans]|uniref:phage holin family protein n=1 Tax=Caldibacillus thermoamylovorans TaxID=35841 RepID=UPI001D07BAD9|nr:phage holin family protein [Caldibacillus thermoamylovorans]MCB5934504.1 phage holin family protein [Bacillus sp. DFI.2.34]MCB7076479.1 phage holin family protein [Caldibacillus thermoamylovorans]
MDNTIKIVLGVGGGLASFLFGGWSALIQTLVFFIVLDYVFAVIVAAVNGQLNSKIGFKGIAKKVAILVLVAVAHQVDLILGDDSLIRDSVIFFYIANELLSILETVGKTSLPIPDVLKKAIEILNNKGEDGSNNEKNK